LIFEILIIYNKYTLHAHDLCQKVSEKTTELDNAIKRENMLLYPCSEALRFSGIGLFNYIGCVIHTYAEIKINSIITT
jgi:hypothetical protein